MEPPVQKEFLIGEPAPRTVFSPLHLRFIDEEEMAQMRQKKESQVLAVYNLDYKAKELIPSRVAESLKKLTTSNSLSPDDSEIIGNALRAVLDRMLERGILEDSEKKKLVDSGKLRIQRFDPQKKVAEELEVKELTSLSEARERADALLEKEGVRAQELKVAGRDLFNALAQPNLFFNDVQTKERLKQAADSIAPVVREIKRGEMVTQKGLFVTIEQQQRLIQIQKKMVQKQIQSRLLTVSLFVLLGLGIIFFYLKHFEPKQFRSIRFVALVLSTFLLTLTAEKIVTLIPAASHHLLPGALAAILMTIFWGLPMGVLGALATPIFSAPLIEFRPEIMLTLCLGSLVGSFASQRVRKRIHFFRVGLAVGVVDAAILIAFFSFQDAGFSEALKIASLGLANGFLVTAIAFFSVPPYEHFFNLTTDITLLELSDLNHPLLKRMVVEAPGTYHHSLVVSTLAEAACEAIGANALLARVGCYFHDIGKIAHSEYFTENQTAQTRNKHEKLTPAMSSLVIMNHVKDGIELAKRSKLKNVIVRFIPEHQGKGIIYYFYKKALDQAAPGETVHPDDFRYPGPKPQSRETAVALLADSVEAASRSMKEFTASGIRVLVRKIINEKFIDGQLDECDLTLKDLHKIQESFVHNLMAIFHTRVNYPPTPADPNRPDLFEADQFTKFR